MPHPLIIIGFLLFGAWIVYNLQKRIGEQQVADWKDFVKANPHLFKQLKPPSIKHGMSEAEKKSSLKGCGNITTSVN